MMFRIISLLLITLIGYSFWSFNHVPSRVRKDLTAELTEILADKQLGKVLIVYYSLDGNTHNVAMRIQQMTGADVFEIETLEPYPSAPAYFWKAWRDLKGLPKIKTPIPDINEYDLIIVGSPAWFYTVSAPVLSFLEKRDFNGKVVVPFVTHGGNIGSFFKDFREKAQNAKVVDGVDFKKIWNVAPKDLNEKISTWLEKTKEIDPKSFL